jgi:hypothetical protein
VATIEKERGDMFLIPDRPNYLQLVPYCHFAEPFPPGVTVAYADSVTPDDELADAAEAIRAAELEAVRTDESDDGTNNSSLADVLESMKLTESDLQSMTIDELRALANGLDIPDRAAITEKSELVDEIVRRL